MTSTFTKASKYMLVALWSGLAMDAALENITGLRGVRDGVEILLMVVLIASFPVAITAFALEKKRNVPEYAWPFLLLFSVSFLLIFFIVHSRAMIL